MAVGFNINSAPVLPGRATRELFILPFDHRGTFQEKFLGIRGRTPRPEEARAIQTLKKVIYEGFKHAIAAGVPREKAGILVDEQFGAEILDEAVREGFTTAICVEKSGQSEFDFEYGAEFEEHIARFNPTFVKVLVRYNPEGDARLNQRQIQRLKLLSDYCRSHPNRLMFELIVPATQDQLEKIEGDPSRFDREVRPVLMVAAMDQIQEAGIEPDLWKLEGLDNEADTYRVAQQARAGGRNSVGVLILGRGENAEHVRHWLSTAAKVPGLIGFAVGRTLFWEPLKALQHGQIGPEEAAIRIGRHYQELCQHWQRAAHLSGAS